MRLSVRLLLLVLMAALPVLAIQVHGLSEQREQRRTQIASQALQLARLAAAQQDQFIESARFLLHAAARLPEVQERDGATCSAHMAELREQFASVNGIGAITPDGVQFCSSRQPVPGVNLADRGYVQRALKGKTLAISGYIVGRITGEPTLNFAYPALGPDGEVRAVVVLAYGLSRLSESLPRTPIAPDATISLVDGNGVLLARAPPAPESIGRPVRDAEFTAAMLARREGILERDGSDGISRLNGFAPLLASADLFAVVGLPWRDAFVEADRLFWREVAVIVFAFALAAVVALISAEFWIRRPVSELQGVVRRMAGGELSARARLEPGSSPELRELGRRFNLMADSLAARRSALQDSEERLRAVVETAADGIVTINDEEIIEFINPEAERLFGYRRDELLGQNVRMLMVEDDQQHEGYLDRYVRDGDARAGGPEHEVTGRRKDGGTFPMFLSVGEFRLKGMRYLTAIIRDITERRQLEEHQQLLVAEIDHRAKNLLASVQSMILLSKRDASSIDAYATTLIGRISAMSRAHDLLSRDRWEGARLHDLIRSELAFMAGGEGQAVAIEGEDVRLSARCAQTLALALHELTTNAAKYGALSMAGGRVTVTSAIKNSAERRVLRLRWRESGGPEVHPPQRRGFGSTLIERGIAHELDGRTETEYAPEGLRCLIEVVL